jgi:hypothetical protein
MYYQPNLPELRKIFTFLADAENYPVYINCAVGSDRTGTLAFLISGVIGRDERYFYDDYELPSFNVNLPRYRYSRKAVELFETFAPEDGATVPSASSSTCSRSASSRRDRFDPQHHAGEVNMKTTKTIAVLLLAVGALAPAVKADAAPPSKDKFKIVVLAGQSNMAGRGTPDAESARPHPRVLMMNRAGGWVPCVDPIHFDVNDSGVGPGKTFAEALAESDPTITVGVVPCAVGGLASRGVGAGQVDAQGQDRLASLRRLRLSGRRRRWSRVRWRRSSGIRASRTACVAAATSTRCASRCSFRACARNWTPRAFRSSSADSPRRTHRVGSAKSFPTTRP